MTSSKWDLRIAQSIARDVAAGLPVSLAAEGAGLPRSTAYYWLAKARENVEPYSQLLIMIDASKKRHAKRLLKRMDSASASGDLRATTWLLENVHGSAFQPQAQQSRALTPSILEAKSLLLQQPDDDSATESNDNVPDAEAAGHLVDPQGG